MNEQVNPVFAKIINGWTEAVTAAHEDFRSLVSVLSEEELVRIEVRLRKSENPVLIELADRLVVERILKGQK